MTHARYRSIGGNCCFAMRKTANAFPSGEGVTEGDGRGLHFCNAKVHRRRRLIRKYSRNSTSSDQALLGHLPQRGRHDDSSNINLSSSRLSCIGCQPCWLYRAVFRWKIGGGQKRFRCSSDLSVILLYRPIEFRSKSSRIHQYQQKCSYTMDFFIAFSRNCSIINNYQRPF